MSIDAYALAGQAARLLSDLSTSSDEGAHAWIKARRRYLRRILALPDPSPRPAWWTEADEAARDPKITIGGWCCRTCCLWRSPGGDIGFCAMPETPATVNCGKTARQDLCEQWTPWPA